MIEALAISIMTMSIALLIVFYYLFKRKYAKLIFVIAQLTIDKDVLLNKIDQINLENSKQVNDGFIKFLSESRESAFKYIEDVQNAIESYLIATENGNADEIATARMELFSHLPEDSENQSK